MTIPDQPECHESDTTAPAPSRPDRNVRRYPVVFHDGNGAELPSWLSTPAALRTHRTYFLVESSVTQAEFHDITGHNDLVPYLGQHLNHCEGDGTFNLDEALERLAEIAEIANEHQRPGPNTIWSPRDRSDFTNDPERAADLLEVLIPCLDCEWKIYEPTDLIIASVAQQSPEGFARYLTIAPV